MGIYPKYVNKAEQKVYIPNDLNYENKNALKTD